MPDKFDELSIRQQELELERARLAVDFAKYGFAGTLTAALVGAGVILGTRYPQRGSRNWMRCEEPCPNRPPIAF